MDIFENIYVVYFCAVAAAIFGAESIYLLVASPRSYRKSVNHRLRVMEGTLDRESILLQLRRERGLDESGNYLLPIKALNRLILQSGIRIGIGRLALYVVIGDLAAVIVSFVLVGDALFALGIAVSGCTIVPVMVLKYLRARRHKKFSAQFPEAIDVIVRSLRAGHPVPVAITMVGREMADPIGSEFGLVADEITYGADLETAIRNMQFRVGQPDLRLFVTSVSIQASTGGNLREILQSLAMVIRDRIKMRRKVKSVSSEARSSAMILGALPPVFFALMQMMSPHFYGSVWGDSIIQIGLAGAAVWMLLGIFIMYRMTKFKI